MYSFSLPNSLYKSANNDHLFQKNDKLTKRHFIKLFEDDISQSQDMNFTLISALRALGATTTSGDNISSSLERYMDVKFSQDIGNVTLAVSKVRFEVDTCHYLFTNIWKKNYSQIIYGLTSRIPPNSTRQTQDDDEEINQFYFYEVSWILSDHTSFMTKWGQFSILRSKNQIEITEWTNDWRNKCRGFYRR